MADTRAASLRAYDNAQQYVYARDVGHHDYVRKANKCTDFVDAYGDKQWDPAVLAELRAERRPALTISKVFPMFGIWAGEQIQNQVDVAFRATSGGTPETAQVLDKALLHVLNSNNFVYLKGEVFDDGVITSRGWYDIRMDFTDNIRGDIRIKRLNGVNVIPDPDADTYDPKDWSQVFITEWHTVDGIASNYGDQFAKELENRPHSAFAYGGADFVDRPVDRFGHTMGYQHLYGGPDSMQLRRFIRVIDRQYKERRMVEHFVDPISGEIRAIPNNWSEEHIREVVAKVGVGVVRLKAEVIRWTTSADDVLLHDSITPYKYFTPVPYFPYLVRGRTKGLVEELVSAQEALNKTRSQELHIVSSIANSGWIAEEGAVRNKSPEEMEAQGAQTGLYLEVTNVDKVKKIAPNQVPTGLDQISRKFDVDLQVTSNMGPGMRAQAREDVSGKALEHQEVRGSVGLGRPMQNLVRSDELIARNTLSLMQRYYTDERVLDVVGNDVFKTSESITVNQVLEDGTVLHDLTAGEYRAIPTTVQSREQAEDTVFGQSMAMREIGVNISDEVIVANSRLPNRNEVLEDLAPNEQQQRAAELEIERAEAEVDKLKAENMDRRAAAVQKVATARRTTAETMQQDGQDGEQLSLEAAQARAELMLEREKTEAELELKRYEIDQKMALEREKMRRESRLKERELAMKREQSNADAA